MATIRELIEGATKTVVRVEKEATGENLPCQLHVWISVSYSGGETAVVRETLNPGNLGVDKFQQAWDAIPDRPQTVNDAIRAKLPDQMVNRLAWAAYKAKYQEEEE